MDWRIITAISCLIATSASEITSSNQTAVKSTSTNTTLTQGTATNTSSSNTSATSTPNDTSSSNTSTSNTASSISSSNTSATNTASNTSSSNSSLSNRTASNTSSSSTSTPSTATNTTSVPANTIAIFKLIFRINETFYSALANNSSPQFADKVKNICSQVEPLYFKSFKNFIRMGVVRFWNGSVGTESYLYFNSSGPNITVSQVQQTILSGINDITFTVISTSLNATQILGNSMAPVIAISLSMISMSLLSLLLSLAVDF